MGKKSTLVNVFLAVLIIFAAALTVSTIVGIQNKIKEGRYIGQEIETKNTLVVSGRGEVYGKPDLGLISFAVSSEAKTVAEAMAQNSQKMNAVIAFVKNQGIEDKDLKKWLDFANTDAGRDGLRQSECYRASWMARS